MADIFDALGMGPKERAETEGYGAEIRQATDDLIAKIQQEAEGEEVTPFTLQCALAANIDNQDDLIGILALAGEALFRLAFPRPEMPSI